MFWSSRHRVSPIKICPTIQSVAMVLTVHHINHVHMRVMNVTEFVFTILTFLHDTKTEGKENIKRMALHISLWSFKWHTLHFTVRSFICITTKCTTPTLSFHLIQIHWKKQGDLYTKTPSLIVQKVTQLSKNQKWWTVGHLEHRQSGTDDKADLHPFSTLPCFPDFSIILIDVDQNSLACDL